MQIAQMRPAGTRLFVLIALLGLIPIIGCEKATEKAAEEETATVTEEPAKIELPSAGYDPEADAQKDLDAAIQAATQSNRRILLEVGGEWCIWCRILEKFLHDHTYIRADLDAAFLVVKVNYSEENKNETFLSKFPEIEGYPHIFVLESDGTLLHSQNTGELEAENSYDPKKISAFLAKWTR